MNNAVTLADLTGNKSLRISNDETNESNTVFWEDLSIEQRQAVELIDRAHYGRLEDLRESYEAAVSAAELEHYRAVTGAIGLAYRPENCYTNCHTLAARHKAKVINMSTIPAG